MKTIITAIARFILDFGNFLKFIIIAIITALMYFAMANVYNFVISFAISAVIFVILNVLLIKSQYDLYMLIDEIESLKSIRDHVEEIQQAEPGTAEASSNKKYFIAFAGSAISDFQNAFGLLAIIIISLITAFFVSKRVYGNKVYFVFFAVFAGMLVVLVSRFALSKYMRYLKQEHHDCLISIARSIEILSGKKINGQYLEIKDIGVLSNYPDQEIIDTGALSSNKRTRHLSRNVPPPPPRQTIRMREEQRGNICPRCKKKYSFAEIYCRECGTSLIAESDGISEEERRLKEEQERQLQINRDKDKEDGNKALSIILLAIAILAALIKIYGNSDFYGVGKQRTDVQQSAKKEAPYIPASSVKNYNVGDIIKFGNYPYEADGTEYPIEWQILEKYTDGTALVISKYALDNVKYNETYTSVTWETSSIRKWLNNDFYNKAFRNVNKNLIMVSYVINKDNARYNTRGGNATTDKLFLLSIEEAEKYFKDDESRIAYPTPYAKSGNSKNGKLYTYAYDGSCWWWLRSLGNTQNGAADVDPDGVVYSFGSDVDNDDGAVRVAFKINLKNL